MSELNNKSASFFSSSLSSPSSIPSISLLGGVVFDDFKVLQNGAKGAFRRLYLALFNWLYPQSKLDSFYINYTIPIITSKYDMRLFDFYYLMRLFYYTGGGTHAIDSRKFKPDGFEREKIGRLISYGFITRSSFNPSAPHLIKNRAIQKVFISFTVDGVKFYNKVLNECYNYAKQDLFKLTQEK